MRKPVIVKLDKIVCEFKLVSNTLLAFAYKRGTSVELSESAVIEAAGRFYEINKIQRCSKERMIYVTATLMAAAASAA